MPVEAPLPFRNFRTERLRLRKLRHTDWEAVQLLRTDPHVNRYIDRKKLQSKEEILRFIRFLHSERRAGRIVNWCMALEGSDVMIGGIGLFRFSPGGHVGEVGYELLPAFQGKGFMHEAMGPVLDHGFQSLGLWRIKAVIHERNGKSVRLSGKSGFRPALRQPAGSKYRTFVLSRKTYFSVDRDNNR